MWRIWKEGHTWGSMLVEDLKVLKICTTPIKWGTYFIQYTFFLIIVSIVADNMGFVSSNKDLLNLFKQELLKTFDFKLFEKLLMLIGLDISVLGKSNLWQIH